MFDDSYDILDPSTRTSAGIAAGRLHSLIRAIRLVVTKRRLPTRVVVSFVRKRFSLGDAFSVFDSVGAEVALANGVWKGWEFLFLDNSGARQGSVTKTCAGIGQQHLTSADDQMIAIDSVRKEK